MSNRKTVAFNTVSQIAGKIITSGTTFVISILIAKTLGASGYGDFTKVTTLVAFFYLFADFGLNTAYLEISDNPKSAGTLLTVRCIFGLLLMFFLLSILNFLPGTSTDGYSPTVKFGIIIFSVSILLQSLITTTNAFFQKQLRYDFAAYALTLGSIGSLLMVALFAYIQTKGVTPYIAALLFGSFITTLTALFFTKKILPNFSLTIDKTLVKNLITIAFPLGLTLLCNVVYFHADSIILTVTRSTNDVGVYGFAYKLFEFFLVIPTFFMNAVFPLLLLSKKQNDMKGFMRQMKQSLAILLSVSILLLIIGYIGSPYITFINKDFQLSILPLRILFLSLPVFFITSLTMWVLIALKKRSQLFFIYFVSMIVNIGSNILFIPTYGYVASAWITVISETIVLLLSVISIQIALNREVPTKI